MSDGDSTLKIPFSKYKLLKGEQDPGKSQFMKYRNSNTGEFSPLSPSRANVVRPGLQKNPNALQSPKVSKQQMLPAIKTGSSGFAKPSTFSKKGQPDKTFSSTIA
jgi:hypothetical protein